MAETTQRAGGAHGDHPTFRHSYSKDKAQLVRRLSRIEGQVRGIARMIEREEYCVDILQQTAALRAAVDAVSILILEDHVQGCVRTAAERGEADKYVDEVLDVVRRTLGRPVRGTKPTRLTPLIHSERRQPPESWTNRLDAPPGRAYRPISARSTCARGTPSARGAGETRTGTDRMARDRQTPAAANDSTPGAAPGRASARPHGGCPGPPERSAPDARSRTLPHCPRRTTRRSTPGSSRSASTLEPAARAAIDAHVRFLLAWTGAINLTAIREPADVARLHVLDSLAAVPPLPALGVDRLLDIGVGRRVPRPAARRCPRRGPRAAGGLRRQEGAVPADGASRPPALGRRVAAEQARSEALARDPRDREAWPAVTARAVASLADLVELGLPLVAPGGVLVAWKRVPAGRGARRRRRVPWPRCGPGR